MAYHGSTPAASALSSSDIATDAVGAAQIAANAVDSSEITSGAVDIAHLSASGTAGSGNFLRGDNSWTAASQFANWSQSSGHLTPDNNTYGIHLGVATATAANLLDDYEEGSWTPLMKGGATDMTTSGYGRYQKIGRVVWLYFNVTVTN